MNIENDRGPGSKRQRPDENSLTMLETLSTHRMKRSISGKFPLKESPEKKAARSRLALASKLRLNPESVEARIAYFGIVKKRKKAKANRNQTPVKKQNGKDKAIWESGWSETTNPAYSRTQDGNSATESTSGDSNPTIDRTPDGKQRAESSSGAVNDALASTVAWLRELMGVSDLSELDVTVENRGKRGGLISLV